MTVLAAAADFHSWCNLIGISAINTRGYANAYKELVKHYSSRPANNTTCDNTCELTGWQTTILPLPIIIDVSTVSQLFISMHIVRQLHYTGDGDSYFATGDGRKLIKILNSTGVLIASVGIAISTRLGSTILADTMLCLFTYNSDGTVNTTVNTGINLYKDVRGNNNNYTDTASKVSKLFSIEYKPDTVTPANSYFRLYKDCAVIGEISGAAVNSNANMSLGSVRLRDNITSAGNVGYTALTLGYLLVSDIPMHGARVYPLKPTALTAGNEFSGVVTSINTTTQDTLYMASAAEVNSKCEFTSILPAGLLSNPTADVKTSSHKLVHLDNYIHARYIQDGGVSCTFSVVQLDGSSSNIYTPVNTVIAANEENSTYRTFKCSSVDVATAANPLNLVTRINLEGV